ncbi:MAG TPA: MOSC domain-containing protein [Chroococcales cyanobacterium]
MDKKGAMDPNTVIGKVLAVCVSKPKPVLYDGRTVMTGIFKTPVEGRLNLSRLNLDGDEQADLTVHGGPDKAVYAYPSEHYPWWRSEWPDVDFPYGKFGENLTTEGLLESDVYIGDEFQIGTAVLRVSQPRLPCYKLGIKFGRNDVIKKFVRSGRSGIYFSVVEEGELGAGDDIRYLRGDGLGIKVQDIANLFKGGQPKDPDFLRRALDSNLAEQMKMFIAGH